jgi:hypothetical protein
MVSLYFLGNITQPITHILRDYQGGYAVRNLTDGVAAVSTFNKVFRSSTRIPQQFIPDKAL